MRAPAATAAALLLLLLSTACVAAAPRPPNIVFIVADDLGFSDLSIQGSPQIPTPNVDAIFRGGATLRGYRAQPVCSPTRASMLSGRHVIHTGIYMPFDGGVTNEALDPRFTLLPRYLARAANYSTALIGKYHIGANTRNATPVGRGFDSAYGYWSGAEDYETHSVTAGGRSVYDMQDDLAADVAANGTFSTALFAARAEALIAAQGAAGADARPLFLWLAFQNVHWPLEAPAEYVARFANATGGNHGRALVCAMAAYLDDAVGNVTRAIAAAGLDERTVVVFVSDNGGRPGRVREEPGMHCHQAGRQKGHQPARPAVATREPLVSRRRSPPPALAARCWVPTILVRRPPPLQRQATRKPPRRSASGAANARSSGAECAPRRADLSLPRSPTESACQKVMHTFRWTTPWTTPWATAWATAWAAASTRVRLGARLSAPTSCASAATMRRGSRGRVWVARRTPPWPCRRNAAPTFTRLRCRRDCPPKSLPPPPPLT